jgi:hypothetical protein
MLSSSGNLPYRYSHIPDRHDCHLKYSYYFVDTVIFHIDTVILRTPSLLILSYRHRVVRMNSSYRFTGYAPFQKFSKEVVVVKISVAAAVVCAACITILVVTVGAFTRPLPSSTKALQGLIPQETRRLIIDSSRANTMHGLTLVHFPPQRKRFCCLHASTFHFDMRSLRGLSWVI